jgi:hypothetical protein
VGLLDHAELLTWSAHERLERIAGSAPDYVLPRADQRSIELPRVTGDIAKDTSAVVAGRPATKALAGTASAIATSAQSDGARRLP